MFDYWKWYECEIGYGISMNVYVKLVIHNGNADVEIDVVCKWYGNGMNVYVKSANTCCCL